MKKPYDDHIFTGSSSPRLDVFRLFDFVRPNPSCLLSAPRTPDLLSLESSSFVLTVERDARWLERVAGKVEEGAEQVEKGVRTGREMVEDWEREYGGNGRGAFEGGRREVQGRGRRRSPHDDPSETEDSDPDDDEPRRGPREDQDDKQGRPLLRPRSSGESTKGIVPYRSARSSSVDSSPPSMRQRKPVNVQEDGREMVEAFLADIDAVQGTIGDLYDALSDLAAVRVRLTSLPYLTARSKLLRNGPTATSASLVGSRREKALKKIRKVTLRSKRGIVDTYGAVCRLGPRFRLVLQAISSGTPGSGPTSTIKISRDYERVNETFAKLLDFVEDRAQDEKGDIEAKRLEKALMDQMKEDHPDWERSKRVEEVKKVKHGSAKVRIDKVDLDSYLGYYALSQPFTELNRTALTTIDLEENGVSSAEPRPSDRAKARKPASARQNARKNCVAGLVETAFDLAAGRRNYESRQTPGAVESGRFGSASRAYLEMGHTSASRESNRAKTFGSEEQDVEAQLQGLIPVRKTEPDIELEKADIPYQVPTDDTSGYQETPEELREDEKDRIKTEHFYTPLLLAVMIAYWAVARTLGYLDPLGNVNFGDIVGQDRWNDTDTFNSSTATTTASMTFLSSAVESNATIGPDARMTTSNHFNFETSSTVTIPTLTADDIVRTTMTTLSHTGDASGPTTQDRWL
ncbi:hypothetical protein JCM10212_002036 [Sporobolomyces blumeae]